MNLSEFTSLKIDICAPSRLRKMSVGTLIWTFVGCALAMFCILAAALLFLVAVQQERDSLEKMRMQSYKLAEELHQSSDDLTRTARSFVVSGDLAYQQRFFDILAIRHGTLPRPSDYSPTYWYTRSLYLRPPANGEAVALRTMMQQAGFSAAEFAVLRQAESRSDILIATEKEAFAALRGRFADGRGGLTRIGTPSPQLARTLLHDASYEAEKSAIMRSIQQFRSMVEARTLADLQRLSDREANLVLLLFAAASGSGMLVLLLTLQLRRLVIQPVRELALQTASLSSGRYDVRSRVRSGNEFETMSDAFNQMASDIEHDIERRKEAQLMLEYESRTDGLTDTMNRRGFDEEFARAWQASVRSRTPLSLLMIDLDCFKQYNDAYGHVAGDRCLEQVAAALKETLNRSDDQLARYGGEEFVVLLPHTDQDGAMRVAEACRRSVEVLRIPHRSGPVQLVTISVGVASAVAEPRASQKSLMLKADRCLYQAKQSGRNVICSDY